MPNLVPLAGFSFSVEILGDSSSGVSSIEAGFQEVTGIQFEMNTDKITEGGENRFVHKVPGRINNDNNLVLKRGLIVASSGFGNWFRRHFSQGLNIINESTKITPQDIIVHLLDANSQTPLISWAFARAFPVKWEISGLNAKDSQIVVENLTLSYAYFFIVN